MKKAYALIRGYVLGVDKLLLLLCAAAAAGGLALVYTATYSYGGGGYFRTQLIAVALGLAAFFIASLVNLEWLSRYWIWILAFNLLLQLSPLFFGVGEGSNKSWIRFWGFGIQPAEVGKLLLIVTFARHLQVLKDSRSSVLSVLQLAAHLGLVTAFVMLFSKDDGMALAYLFIGLFMAFAAGIQYRWFLLGGATAAVAAPLVWRTMLDEYQKLRILVTFNPALDPDKAYQAAQAKKAIGSGLLQGRGFLSGTLTQKGLIPTKHTDSIFAVAGEEFGFIGAFAILLILTCIILRCLATAARTAGSGSSLVCTGMAGMLMFQTLLNVGMNIGLLPVVGLTLPFFSYGGSSMVAMFAAMGVVAGVRWRSRGEENAGRPERYGRSFYR